MYIIKARERWKELETINGKKYKFAKKYLISNYGNLKTDNGYIKKHYRKGYHQYIVYYRKNKEINRKCISINRIVYEHFVGNLDTELKVHHKDKDPNNNYYKNLEAMSEREHMNLHKMSKLISDDVVKIICSMIQDNYKNVEIIKNIKSEYPHITINNALLSDIRLGRKWNNISKNFIFEKNTEDYIVNEICILLSQNCNNKYIVKTINDKFDSNITKSLVNSIRLKNTHCKISKNYEFPKFSKLCVSELMVHNICKLIKNNYSDERIFNKYRYSHTYVTIDNIKDIRAGKSYVDVCNMYF